MDCVVAPLLQLYELPALAVSITLPPWQNARGPLADTKAGGLAFTVTVVAAEVALQPDALVTETV